VGVGLESSGGWDDMQGVATPQGPAPKPGVIRMMCPNLNCRTVLGVPQEARGKMVRCRACGTSIRVPDQGAAVAGKAPEPAVEDDSAAA